MENKKVLLILLDGMRPDALESCGCEFLPELKKHSHYTMAAKTVMPSVTLPCHMSLFHSVEPSRHGILTNTYVPQVRPVQGICEVLCQAGKKSGMFYTWEELKDITRPGSMTRTSFYSGHILGGKEPTELVAKDACAYLKDGKPDFCFLYLGVTDDMGHKYGWMSEEYITSIRECMDLAKEAMNCVGDEYVTILTADHGGHDRTHGYDLPEDMTIPMFFHHSSFSEEKLEEASILDIAPTIAKLIGVRAPADWEGVSRI